MCTCGCEDKALKDTKGMRPPLCPNCHTHMYVTHFQGYYDELFYWTCECDLTKEKPSVKWKGGY